MTCSTCNQEPNHFHQLAAHTDCGPAPKYVNACQDMEVQELAELPVDDLESVPDYFLVERDVLDQSTGKVLHSIVRMPGNRVLPNGNLANSFTLDGNNPTLNLVEGQPLPAYVQNEGASNVVYPADSSHKAQFFVTGTIGDLLLCQGSGVMHFLGGTDYIVGMTYYLSSTAGEVTTNPSETGQALFTVLSPTKLLIKL